MQPENGIPESCSSGSDLDCSFAISKIQTFLTFNRSYADVYFLDYIFEIAFKKMQRELAKQKKQIYISDPVRLTTIKYQRAER